MPSCRVENLQKFKDADEDSVPALVCTDLAARGLDLVCDHVINFDFPLNPVSYSLKNSHFVLGLLHIQSFVVSDQHISSFSYVHIRFIPVMLLGMLQIDYLHRTGRTARMGAKGRSFSFAGIS